MNTRPCVCQGSNENCRYCAGRGFVEAGTGLPSGIGQKELRISGGGPGRIGRPNLPCPICGVHVSRLQRHMHRRHGGGLQQRSLISSVGKELAISSATKDRQPNRARFEPSVPPIHTNSQAASVSQLSGDPKPAPGGVRCPRCLVLFDCREALRNHLRGNCSTTTAKARSGVALTRCPGCGTSVRQGLSPLVPSCRRSRSNPPSDCGRPASQLMHCKP